MPSSQVPLINQSYIINQSLIRPTDRPTDGHKLCPGQTTTTTTTTTDRHSCRGLPFGDGLIRFEFELYPIIQRYAQKLKLCCFYKTATMCCTFLSAFDRCTGGEGRSRLCQYLFCGSWCCQCWCVSHIPGIHHQPECLLSALYCSTPMPLYTIHG